MLRKATLVLIVAVGLAAIAIVFVSGSPYARKHLKTCFADAQGLRSGAAVRIAGVEVGSVRRMHVNPERKDCPAEVEMDTATSYEIKIPKDSVVELATAGVLGETYVEIDTAYALGSPLEDYGYLKSKPAVPALSVEDYRKDFGSLIGRVSTALAEKMKGSQDPTIQSLPSTPTARQNCRASFLHRPDFPAQVPSPAVDLYPEPNYAL